MASRRTFLKTLTAGGVGLLAGPAFGLPPRWTHRGTPLVHVRRRSLVMGAVATFDVVASTEQDGYAAIRRAVRIFRDLDARLSMYAATSEVTTLKQQAGRAPVAVSSDTTRVLAYAQDVARATRGLFDVTVEPLMRRWGFRGDPDDRVSPPSEAELRRLEECIGYEKLHLEGGKAHLTRPGMAIDVGGIAGGYALDRAVAALRSADVAAALIDFSGDLHCLGTPAENAPWTVHLLDPYTETLRPTAIPLHDEALSTSGSYQNRRHSAAGASWGHLIATDRARPIEPVGSVTAIHSSAMVADAWSTAAYLGASPTDPDLRLITL